MTFHKILLSFLILLISACATAPVKLTDYGQGHWRAKALIKDLEQNRSYVVYLNFNAVKDEQARMDVSSALGTGVASLVVGPKDVRYILFDSKRFYYGPSQSSVMRPILAMPFDPRWIHNVLFEKPLVDKEWQCTRDQRGFIENCFDSATDTRIVWSARHGDRRSVVLEHPKASVQITFQSFQPKVEDRKNLFVLEAPEGYEKLRVR